MGMLVDLGMGMGMGWRRSMRVIIVPGNGRLVHRINVSCNQLKYLNNLYTTWCVYHLVIIPH